MLEVPSASVVTVEPPRSSKEEMSAVNGAVCSVVTMGAMVLTALSVRRAVKPATFKLDGDGS